jgi:hypothetical protein
VCPCNTNFLAIALWQVGSDFVDDKLDEIINEMYFGVS